MDKYEQAEQELASLLGYEGMCRWVDGLLPKHDIKKYVPHWIRDDASILQLMIEYRIQPQYYNTMFYLIAYNGIHPTRVYIEEHNNDRMLAFRYGVVLAVIQKLKEEQPPTQ